MAMALPVMLAVQLVVSLAMVALGLWHLCCCSRAFLKSPRDFCARTWHPCPPRFRHLELYCELLAVSFALLYQGIALSTCAQGSTAQILGLQLFVMLLMFFLVLLITLISDSTAALPLPNELLFLLLGVAFSVEWMVLDRLADPKLALERECFVLLGVLAALGAGSCLLLAWRPKVFIVNLVLCASISLQGTWLLQTGLSLFYESFLPEGCHRLSSGSTQCDVDAAKLRAIALMDLAFLVHIILMICAFAFVYGLISRVGGYRRNGGYDALEANGESDHVQARPLSTKVVID